MTQRVRLCLPSVHSTTLFAPRTMAVVWAALLKATMHELSLPALFVSSFLAATLLPGGSEIVFLALLKGGHTTLFPALLVGTIGNTLGGMTSYFLGRAVPRAKTLPWIDVVRHYGSVSLLFAWAPIIGDALCVAAGWLRLNPWWVTLFMGIGKAARYWALALLAV